MGPVYLFVATADEPRARELLDSVAVAEAPDEETTAVKSLNGDEPAG
jgi:hypothetical protein